VQQRAVRLARSAARRPDRQRARSSTATRRPSGLSPPSPTSWRCDARRSRRGSPRCRRTNHALRDPRAHAGGDQRAARRGGDGGGTGGSARLSLRGRVRASGQARDRRGPWRDQARASRNSSSRARSPAKTRRRQPRNCARPAGSDMTGSSSPDATAAGSWSCLISTCGNVSRTRLHGLAPIARNAAAGGR
jgi:hypothetical protein